MKSIIKKFIPPERYMPISKWWKRFPPLRWGSFRRVKPISNCFGFDRGTPIDRYYIELFIEENKDDIQGHVLEVLEPLYIKKFGEDRVKHFDILHATEGNPNATLVGDLSTGAGIPKSAFDCIILTQTLQFIYDVSSAIENAYSALKPNGVLLVTLPGVSQISREDVEKWGEYWRFTTCSIKKLFSQHLPSENLTIQAYGNVLSAVSILHGVVIEELKKSELDINDPNYEVLITIRAVKPAMEALQHQKGP